MGGKKKKTSTFHRKHVASQCEYSTSNYNVNGGMYSGSTDNNLTWNILVNKLALISRVPFDCGRSSDDCFLHLSVGPSLQL